MMRRSILASITGAVLATTVVAGCSDESGKSGKVAAVDACALLTVEDFNAVFDRTFNADKPGPSGGGGANQGAMTSCAWVSPGAEVAGKPMASLNNTYFTSLFVWSWPAGSGSGSGSYMNAFVEGAKANNQPVPVAVTLGDAALWGAKMMHVKKGDVTMTLSLKGPGDEASKRAAAESLMKTALGRL